MRRKKLWRLSTVELVGNLAFPPLPPRYTILRVAQRISIARASMEQPTSFHPFVFKRGNFLLLRNYYHRLSDLLR